jgi:hypothetical protein
MQSQNKNTVKTKMKEKIALSLPLSLIGILSLTFLIGETSQAQAPQTLQGVAEMQARIQQARDYVKSFPKETIDTEAYAKARAQQSKMRPMKMGVKAPTNTMQLFANGVNITYSDKQWEQMGPFNMTPPYTGGLGSGFVTGRTNGVAYDMGNPNTRYVIAPSGGVWKTTNQGSTWKPLGDNFPTLNCSSVATDPRNGRVIYVGTGDFSGTRRTSLRPVKFDATGFYSANVNAYGIMKSTNGGNTFVNVGRVEMAGSAVSAIIVDPTDSRLVLASTGRGPTLGCLWRSVNGGTTWVKPKLILTNADGSVVGLDAEGNLQAVDMPTGDWTNVKIYNAYNLPQYRFATIPQYYFATRIGNDGNAGLYRSDDRGATWVKLKNAPLRYNGVGFIPNNSLGVLELSPSIKDPKTIYVMDSNSGFSDGKHFRAKLIGDINAVVLDASGKPVIRKVVQRDVNGNIIRDVNGNPVTKDDTIPDWKKRTNYSWVEVTGSFPINDGVRNNWSSGAIGALLMAVPARVQADANNPFSLVDDEIVYGGSSTLSAAVPLQDVRNWQNISFSYTNAALSPLEQISMAYNPQTTGEQMLANRGGSYTINYDPDNGGFSFFSNNTNLVVTQFINADFNPLNSNAMLGATETVGLAQFDLTRQVWKGIGTISTAWNSTPNNVIFTEGYSGPGGGLGPSQPPLLMGSVAIHPARPNVQYAANGAFASWNHTYAGDFSGRIYYTNDNWVTSKDITPDRYDDVFNASGTLERRYFFPFQNDTDSSVGSAWAGQPKPLFLKLAPVPNATALYTGTNQLWRYDEAPARKPDTSTPPKQGFYGWWRPVGSQVFGSGVSAIAVVGSRVYVGTLDGRVWMVRNITVTNAQGDLAANFTELTTGLGRQTLPLGAITDIKNVDPSNPGDILVSIGGTAPQGHLWRCADTTANNIIFTSQNGDVSSGDLIPSFLPNVPINEIAVDPNDPLNTWLVGTDIGVFGTNNHGTTWNDATAPLGLPNVEITSLKLSATTGYLSAATYGRGAWKFDLGKAKEARNPASLSISYTLSRSGGEIFAVVRVANASGASVGPAESVTLTASSLKAGNNTGVPTTTGLPILLGTLGPGKGATATLRFPASVGQSGIAANFNVSYTYAGAAVTDYSSRTRLP